ARRPDGGVLSGRGEIRVIVGQRCVVCFVVHDQHRMVAIGIFGVRSVLGGVLVGGFGVVVVGCFFNAYFGCCTQLFGGQVSGGLIGGDGIGVIDERLCRVGHEFVPFFGRNRGEIGRASCRERE